MMHEEGRGGILMFRIEYLSWDTRQSPYKITRGKVCGNRRVHCSRIAAFQTPVRGHNDGVIPEHLLREKVQALLLEKTVVCLK